MSFSKFGKKGVRSRSRSRHVPGQKNKTEQRYEDEVLLPMLVSGEIASYRFEPVKLRLADNTYYSPDYMVVMADGLTEYHEVKACTKTGKFLVEDDANVKIKVAAEQYPEWKFKMCGAISKNNGGGWKYREYPCGDDSGNSTIASCE